MAGVPGANSFPACDDLEEYGRLLQRTVLLVIRWAAPPLLLSWLIAAGGVVAQGGFVFAPAALSLNPGKLNPASNLGRLFSLASLRGLLKSLLPAAYLLYLGITLISGEWDKILRSCFLTPRASSTWLFALAYGLVWKAGLVFAVWFLVDYLLERMSFERQLRMSRQEIREEAKETEGHPMIRSRLRRLQRQMRKRRMLKDVARASVVVTNPTEYAVALEYRPEEMAAPVVVAKGQPPSGTANQARSQLAWNSHHREPAAGSGALPQRRGWPGHSRQAVCGRGGDSGLHLPPAGTDPHPTSRERKKVKDRG